MQNIHLAEQVIRDKSAILKEMEQKGAIKIVGAIYNLATGRVEFEQ
jgi:carbonic anhydrase